MMKKQISLVLFVLLGSVVGAAYAQNTAPQPRSQAAFSAFDTDGNGMISEEEFNAGRGRFRGMKGGCGQPGKGADGGRGRGRRAPDFTVFDLNKDGIVTEAELTEARAKRQAERDAAGYAMRKQADAPAFAEMDANGDGKLTPEEFNAFRTMRRSQMTR